MKPQAPSTAVRLAVTKNSHVKLTIHAIRDNASIFLIMSPAHVEFLCVHKEDIHFGPKEPIAGAINAML